MFWKVVLSTLVLFSVGCFAWEVKQVWVQHSKDCERLCNLDADCASWSVERLGIRDLTCFLESDSVHGLKGLFPDLFARDSVVETGTKRDLERRNVMVDSLLTGPVSIDRTSLLNVNQHFLRGCSYTISMWIWIWKSKGGLPDGDQIAVFSTRKIYPSLSSQEQLFPTLLFNVGKHKDKLFFSVSKDPRGLHLGVWADFEVRYHEWIHVAVTVDDRRMNCFINGKFVEYANLFTPDPDFKCPYDVPVHSDSNSSHFSSPVDNSILQVGGGKEHWPMTGLIQDVLVFRNIALSEQQISEVMAMRPAMPLPTMLAIMRSYGIASLEGTCERPWRGDFYLLWSWGICPEAVCGPICIDENFILGRERLGFVKREGQGWEQGSVQTTSWFGLSQAGEVNTLAEDLVLDMYGYSQEELDRVKSLAADGESAKTLRSLVDQVEVEGGADGMDGTVLYDGYDDYYGYGDGNIYGGDGDAYGSFDVYGEGNSNYGNMGFTSALKAAEQAYDDEEVEDANVKMKVPRGIQSRKGSVKISLGVGVKEEEAHSPSPDEANSQLPTTPAQSADAPPSPPSSMSSSGLSMAPPDDSPAVDRGRDSVLPKRLSTHFKRPYVQLRSSPSATSAARSDSNNITKWFDKKAKNVWGSLVRSWTSLVSSVAGTEPSPAVKPVLSAEDIQLAALVRQTGQSVQDFDANERIQQIHETYAAAVTWMSGRYVNFQSDKSALASDVLAWRQRSAEKILSALFLTVFLADDVYATASDMDVDWSFLYPSVISQPAHIALAFRSGYDSDTHLRFHHRESVIVPNISSIVKPAIKLLIPDEKSISKVHRPATAQRGVGTASNKTHWLELFSQVEDLSLQSVLRLIERGESVESMEDYEPLVRSGITAEVIEGILNHSSATKSSTIIRSRLSAQPHPWTTNECRIAAAYYFPVTQYVASHFSLLDTGVGHLEDVSLEDGDFTGYEGEDDELQLHFEAEAEAGDVNAQLWLGRRYRWGYGGIEADLRLARRWYERAAAQGSPEGLYNIGSYNWNGIAGFARNQDVAVEYFLKAVNNTNPFPMALHALGNFYLEGSSKQAKNLTLARYYYEKAAELNSPEGHFSLAMMLREGKGGPPNVPLAVSHLAIASSLNHVRSINFLAHGLFDPESWLGQYGRELKNLTSASSNSSGPVVVYLSSGPVHLPHPLTHSCEAALPLLRHLAEMGYRTNDLSRAGLAAYLEGELWEALEYYEEAADLGVEFSQENAAYLYRELKHRECGNTVRTPVGIQLSFSKSVEWSESDIQVNTSSNYFPKLSKNECENYFERMSSHRWLQLANSGDFVAVREMAQRILIGHTFQKNSSLAVQLLASSGERGDAAALMALGWAFRSGHQGIESNRTAAKLLFQAARQLETNSTVALEGSTFGVAPVLAQLLLQWDDFIDFIDSQRQLSQLLSILPLGLASAVPLSIPIDEDLFLIAFLIICFLLVWVLTISRKILRQNRP